MSNNSCCCKCGFRIPSLVKKYLMAVTGLILVGFVGGHMLGNLQMFESPEAINKYAYFLQHLPWEFLWGYRVGLLACLVIHFAMGISLKLENYAARPKKYDINATVKASLASRSMVMTGTIIVVFFVLHIMQFTLQNLQPVTQAFDYVNADGKVIHDVYAMVVWGFSQDWYAIFYIVAVLCLGIHVSHGASSMFQSVGLRNERVRGFFGCLAACFALAIFGGFALLPAGVLASKYIPCVKIFPVQQVMEKGAAWDGQNPIFIQYGCDKKAVCGGAPATVCPVPGAKQQ